MCDGLGKQMGPWKLARNFWAARETVPGPPDGYRFHDLRHYYASLLISSRLGVRVVQARAAAHLREDHTRQVRASVARLRPRRSGRHRRCDDGPKPDLADYLRTEGGGSCILPRQ